jgi:hypothetical protein
MTLNTWILLILEALRVKVFIIERILLKENYRITTDAAFLIESNLSKYEYFLSRYLFYFACHCGHNYPTHHQPQIRTVTTLMTLYIIQGKAKPVTFMKSYSYSFMVDWSSMTCEFDQRNLYVRPQLKTQGTKAHGSAEKVRSAAGQRRIKPKV